MPFTCIKGDYISIGPTGKKRHIFINIYRRRFITEQICTVLVCIPAAESRMIVIVLRDKVVS